MSGHLQTRLPLEPLLAVLRLETGLRDHHLGCLCGEDVNLIGRGRDTYLCLSLFAIADAVSVHPAQVARWRREGGLTITHADRAAIRLGLWPTAIWPEFYDVAVAANTSDVGMAASPAS